MNWFAKVYDKDVLFLTKYFSTQREAAKYALEWNSYPNLRFRAESGKVGRDQ